ncbi:MAG: amidase family protein [Caldilineaceae bacterium]
MIAPAADEALAHDFQRRSATRGADDDQGLAGYGRGGEHAGDAGGGDFVPAADATVVARMKAAGAILLGKTNTSEFTLSFFTNNPIFGPTQPVRSSMSAEQRGAALIVAAGDRR